MARIKDILVVQKTISHAFWESDKIQNEIAVQVGCSESDISKISRRTCLKRPNCGSKPKITVKDERFLNRILISNQFANRGIISKTCNDVGVAVS